MIKHKIIPYMLSIFFLFLCSSCGASPPEIQSTTHETYQTEMSIVNNACDVTGIDSASHAHYEEAFSVNVSGTVSAGVEAAVKSTVSAQYGEGRKTTIAWDYDWPNGKKQQATLTWYWEKWSGDFSSDDGPGKFVAVLPTKVETTVEDLPCIDISGNWSTPLQGLSYNVDQDSLNYSWLIRENGIAGPGIIEGETVAFQVDGQKVVYLVGEWDSNDNPTVLYTAHPDYWGVILFRSCADFESFLIHLGERGDENFQTTIENIIHNLPNPTCPNILP